MGCLALIQPLYLVMDPNILPFTRAVHKLSLDENQEFPMMVLIINLIRISFCAMKVYFKRNERSKERKPRRIRGTFFFSTCFIFKDGLINRFCNEEGDFWKGFNFFSAAVLFHYYTLWKTGRKTIKDSGYVLKGTY